MNTPDGMKETIVQTLTIDEARSNNVFHGDYVEIDIGQSKSAIGWARIDRKAYDVIKELVRQDYTYFHQRGTVSRFIKRPLVKTMWRKVLENEIQFKNDVYWTEQVVGEHVENAVVVFSSLPPQDKYFSHRMYDRCFNQNNPRISQYLRNNTVYIRIADLNCMYGSYYLNTTNYPNYEAELSEAFLSLQSKYRLQNSQILMYGSSKGGTGAFLFSQKHNYKCLVCDPIINMDTYNDDNDLHYLKGMELEHRFDKFKQLPSGTNRRIVIASERIQCNFPILHKLHRETENFEIVNLKFEYIKNHPDVTLKTLNYQNMFMNELLGPIIQTPNRRQGKMKSNRRFFFF